MIDDSRLQSNIVWHYSDGVVYVVVAFYGCDSQISFKSIPNTATDLGTFLFSFSHHIAVRFLSTWPAGSPPSTPVEAAQSRTISFVCHGPFLCCHSVPSAC